MSGCDVERCGSEGMGIHRTHPPPAYGGLGAVTGGRGEQRDGIADPITVLRTAVGRKKG